jgi:hypothetical protein
MNITCDFLRVIAVVPIFAGVECWNLLRKFSLRIYLQNVVWF